MPLLRVLLRSADGGVALTFALTVPVLLLATALAVDSASLNNQSGQIQSIADSTALAVAKELHLLANDDAAEEAGSSRAKAMLAEAGLSGLPHEIDVQVNRLDGQVNVGIKLVGQSFLPAEASGGETPIAVNAIAQTYGQLRVCVLGLDSTRGETVMGGNGAVLVAPDCAVQSNSSDQNALVMKDGSALVAQLTCTSGGYSGSIASYTPAPQTDCPQLSDPLMDRLPPDSEGCDHSREVHIAGGNKTISPGIYCQGLRITNKAKVTAEPGIYVIKGGKFTVANDAELRGENVSFYFADDAATLVIENDSLVELTAPKDGPMAGILFFEDRGAPPGREFVIRSSLARRLVGTIYLPEGLLRVEGNNTVAAASEYTIIVADQVDIRSAKLVINADYGASDIPVPSGLGPNSESLRLVK